VHVKLYAFSAGVLFRLTVGCLLVDVDVLAVLWAGAVFENTYVLSVFFASLSRLDVDGEGFLVFRVTFPPGWELCRCF
jgi:hypothetical protein